MMKILLMLALILVGFPVMAAPTITVTGTNSSVTAVVSGGPGNTTDWIGLYNSVGNSLAWRYLSGTQSPPTQGLTEATVTFPGLPDGTYSATFYANNGGMVLASTQFVIPTAPPPSNGAVSSIKCTGIVNCPNSTGDVTVNASLPAFISPTLGSPCNKDDNGFNFNNVGSLIIYACRNGVWGKSGAISFSTR